MLLEVPSGSGGLTGTGGDLTTKVRKLPLHRVVAQAIAGAGRLTIKDERIYKNFAGALW